MTPETPERSGRKWVAVAAWIVLAGAAVFAVGRTVAWDFRAQPVVGDQASHLLQALSLAHDGDVHYDAGDLARWREVGWHREPLGLFFQSDGDGGWAFAKPYGYSLWLAPFVRAFGAVPGVAVANAVLLVVLAALTVALAAPGRRIRSSPSIWRDPVAPLVAAAVVFGSHLWLSAFSVHTELLLAALVAAWCLAVRRWATSGAVAAAAGAGAVAGFLLTDKPVFAVLMAPAFGWLGVRELRGRRWPALLAPAAALVATFAVASVPYLVASGGAAATPYGGERYYVRSSTPFDPAEGNPERRSTTGEARDIPRDWGRIESHDAASPLRLAADALTDPGEPLKSAGFTVVGRHTGLLVFDTFALVVVVAGLARWHRLGGVPRAALAGVLGYLAFYVVVFPDNYYGGSQSIGNRYFAQVLPVAAVVAGGLAAQGRRGRTAVGAAAVAGGLACVALMWPLVSSPEEAFTHPARTSPVQQLLPVETTQDPVVNVLCRSPDADCR